MKKIRKWKSDGNTVQAAVYLREMAEQGYILEEMNHLWYVFREDMPAYLQYRLETRTAAPSEAERAAYAEDGWQEVCHYELDYIFAKEREPFAEPEDINPTEIAEVLDKKIEAERKDERFNRWGELAVVVFAVGVVLLADGFSEKGLGLAGSIFLRYVPLLLLAFLLSRWRIRKMTREKEEILAGDIPEKYIDWRKKRTVTTLFLVVFILGLAGWVFYKSGFNEKTFDLPQEISYAELPAVRLENLTEEELKRSGDSIDPDMEGIRLNVGIGEGNLYEIKKEMGGFENYAVAYRYLLKTEQKLETRQCMQTADGTKLYLDTMYERYRSEDMAEQAFLEGVQAEKENEERREEWREDGAEIPLTEKLSPDTDAFYDLFVTRMEWEGETTYYVLCRWENQLMEMDFRSTGELDLEQLLVEAEKVFAAQQEN